ncbi:hypothetical protein RhoFasGS6_03809 [Rhodococcus fascians]|uniref:hypothetical protein n=1 Tax=Rhodococcoides fascians TaxID=1828 RepID=UPI001427BD63|nr:hypothetical protein [Rhodococcus fascians]
MALPNSGQAKGNTHGTHRGDAHHRHLHPAAIIEYCRTELASYKAPKSVHIVAELPVDPQGKILKRELRLLAAVEETV